MAGFAPTALRTGRLTLRPIEAGDVDAYLTAVDDEVRRWMPWSEDFTREKAVRWCTEEAAGDLSRALNFAIVPGDAGRLEGGVGIGRADWETGVAETGYWLGPAARGRGYATEAVRAVARHAFGLGLTRVELLAAVGNVASQRVAERAGFTREDVLREARPLPGGKPADMVRFRLLKDEL
ncbi:GNAT family N-acetyltransferase [Actinoallomurus iriomotensis]|uniref:Acetyltransferase n=1 Tax=Actinoallomurus iriomotensis TaxID=478107 RepID=A0A9W6VT95_9ACTN|nr:GNAT family N-acetyltransferase [Actinoallomurus iriomotensis]GLY79505.1 acetyltransferase [Actinoallomurus iriomotensis]